MSETEETASEAGIIASILADADAQAAALLAEAESEARALRAEAAREAQAATTAIEAKARHDAEARATQICARARVQARRTLLHAREAAIDELLARAHAALQALRGDAGRYRSALAGLVAEAIRGIGETPVTVLLSEADRVVAQDHFWDEVRGRVRMDGGLPVEIECQFLPKDLGGGGIALSPDGRARLYNTLPQRMKEARPRLKARIALEFEERHG